MGSWRKSAERFTPPTPPASTVRNRQRLQPSPYWFPFCPVRPPIPRDNRQHLHGNKRPVSHRKREPFRPFLFASFNSRNSPFYCCKKFNFSRFLNVSPIVAQPRTKSPFLRYPKIQGGFPVGSGNLNPWGREQIPQYFPFRNTGTEKKNNKMLWALA